MNGKKRNKKLLEHLAEHNRRLSPAPRILSGLGLNNNDLRFLNALGRLANGWHRPPLDTPGDQVKLAELGLMYIHSKKHEISLSDAGRFLLVLTASHNMLG